ARFVDSLLPSDTVTPLQGVSMGVDRLIIFGVAVAATVVLAIVYRFTRFGLATAAVAESQRTAAVYGVSPDWVASVNWMAAGVLAALGCILIAPIAGLEVASLTLLVIPAFAAALLGAFRSFGLTMLGAIVIGVSESELTRFVQTPGVAHAVPLLVIVAVLVLRRPELAGRVARRGRPPHLGSGRVRLVPTALALVVGVVVLAGVPARWADPAATSIAMGVVLASLVVVAGYTGQLSLAQFTLAGIAAWVASRSIVNYGLPMEAAIGFGVIITVVVGVGIGMTALRSRGVSLAIATLALALVLQDTILNNSARTGGLNGTNIGRFSILGIDLTGFDHPQRYAIACLVVLVGTMLALANLRRGRAGLQLIAVRTNERAAAALGVNVAAVKLYAFALSSAIAAVAGILIGFRNPSVTFGQFNVLQSIYAVSLAVTGGIGFVIGAPIAAVAATGGIVTAVVNGNASGVGQLDALAALFALLAVVVVVREPDGIARRLSARLGARLRPVNPSPSEQESLPPASAMAPVRPARLTVNDLAVTFGGVRALDGLCLEVGSGDIVGLIGPNGAGKTTAIDAITGFTPTTGGSIALDGHAIGTWSPRRRAHAGLARTFQSLELFDSLTVRDNLRIAADARAWWRFVTDLVRPGRPTLDADTMALVHAFGLTADLDRAVEELALGRRRLVALARALASRPSIVLLDEPAAGLDQHERAELADVIRMVATEWGCGVLIVEHDINLIFSLCQHVEVLDFGRPIASGTAATVRDTPAVITAYLGVDQPATPDTRARGQQADGAAIITARGVSVGHRDVPALRGLDIDIHPGRVTALLGPNGAGKTTTILTIAGHQAVLQGELAWRGDPHRRAIHQRVGDGAAIVLDDRSILTGLTVTQNLRLAKVDPDRVIEIFPELQTLLTRRAGLLSGGEQQMVSLGRALASDPEILLVDELSLGLAPLVVARLFAAIRNAADHGVAVLLVEQQATAVLRFADDVIVVGHG
ncbi:MAG: amino acid/amide transporter rane protein 2, family / amino acid/amide transporter, partial [Acidimicrobiales bacterium]|nr:amino acid/amide transporter rane protein 2, family / amino acid/amide transporter [Acidimicrobiales bacterium]